MNGKFLLLKKRADITESIRKFFLDKGYLQTETPVLAPHVIPEAHIEIFKTEFISLCGERRPLYLLPSPELYMKKLIAQGSGSIFQICKSFRNYEEMGRHHSPEFTMLEWYTVDADYNDSIKLTEEFLKTMFGYFRPEYMNIPFKVIDMQEAFKSTTGIDILKGESTEELKREALKNGFDIPDDYTWEETFNKIFLEVTEPALCGRGITLLKDYPVQIPCTAKKKNRSFYERWELYIDGIEIANCYTEERDPDEVKKFYKRESAAKEGALVPVTVDPSYCKIFSSFPPCSGTALGVDRLVMALTGAENIDDVLAL